MYLLKEKKTGLYMYKPSQWGNKLTEDIRGAKIYKTKGLALKSVSHGIKRNLQYEKGKWLFIELVDIITGKEEELLPIS